MILIACGALAAAAPAPALAVPLPPDLGSAVAAARAQREGVAELVDLIRRVNDLLMGRHQATLEQLTALAKTGAQRAEAAGRSTVIGMAAAIEDGLEADWHSRAPENALGAADQTMAALAAAEVPV